MSYSRLEAIRNELGYTQRQVAAELGRTQGYVSKLESKELEKLKLGEVRAYLQAMGRDLFVWLDETGSAVQ